MTTSSSGPPDATSTARRPARPGTADLRGGQQAARPALVPHAAGLLGGEGHREVPGRLDATVLAYRAVLVDWNDNLTRVRALVHTRFSEEASVPGAPGSTKTTSRSARSWTSSWVRCPRTRASRPSVRGPLSSATTCTGSSAHPRRGAGRHRARGPRRIRTGPVRGQGAAGPRPSSHTRGRSGRTVQAAVRAFQERAGLPVDGIAGPGTRSALREHGTG